MTIDETTFWQIVQQAAQASNTVARRRALTEFFRSLQLDELEAFAQLFGKKQDEA